MKKVIFGICLLLSLGLHTAVNAMSVPDIDTSFKTWMSYKAITNTASPQYKLIKEWAWCDSQGFMRCNGERDLGVTDDYYLIALGSFYGTEIGTKYKITLDSGNIFYGVLADCKADKHTNSTHQYAVKNKDVVEFLVDVSKLNQTVKKMGNANYYPGLDGRVVNIEKLDF